MTTARNTTTHRSPTDGRSSTLGALLMTPEQAAEMLCIGRTKVYELMATGRLRSVCIGRSRRVTAAALADFVSRLDGQEA